MNFTQNSMNLFRSLLSSKKAIRLRILWELIAWKITNKKYIKGSLADRKLKILIASNIGENLNTLGFDVVLGKALKSRGHEVSISICEGGFDACMYGEISKFRNPETFINRGMKDFCKSCTATGKRALRIAGLNRIPVSNSGEANSSELREAGLAGAYRFLAIGQESELRNFDKVVKRFIAAAKQFANSFSEIFEKEFDVIICHHGIYVPQGVVSKLCGSPTTKLVTWVQSYRQNTFIFSWDDTYHKTLLRDEIPLSQLSAAQKHQIKSYLDSREAGTNDWISFSPTLGRNRNNLRLDKATPIFALFTNVAWDAQLHYESRLFTNMHEWVLETVEWFATRRDIQLIIRVHPAEVSGRIKSRDPISQFLMANFPKLPGNITLVDAHEKISSYEIMERADFGIIFATKAGIELATKGKPVVVAGEAWLKNKGIAIEPTTKNEYFETLAKLARNEINLPENYEEKALRFAYYYFFERMIEVSSIKPIKRYPYLRPRLKVNWEVSDSGLLSIVKNIENQLPFLSGK